MADKAKPALLAILAVAAAAYAVGLGFGLPSTQRRDRVFLPEQRDDAFYGALERNRRAYYASIGENLQAAGGRGWTGTLIPPPAGFVARRYPAGQQPPDPVLMHGFSSFALRSTEQDEQFVLNSVARLRPRRLQFDPHETQYGGSYIYPLAAWWAALHVARVVRLDPDALHYYREPADIARLYLTGRVFSVVWGLAGAWLLFLLADELYGPETGLWAAALYAFSPIVVSYAHVLKPHLEAAALGIAALWRAARAAKRREPAALRGAAALYGLAVGAAKNLWPAAAPLALAAWASEDAPAGAKLRRLAACAALSVGVFALTNPFAFIDWRDFIDEMRLQSQWYHASLDPSAVLKTFVGPMRAGLGLVAWCAAIAAAVVWARRRRKEDLFVAASAGAIVVVSALQLASVAGDAASARFYLLPIALCCAAAASLASGPALRPARALLALAVACDLGLAAVRGANFAADRPGRSFADQAADWLADAVPPGGELGMGTPAPMVDRFPPVPFSRYTLVYTEGRPDQAQARALPERYVTNALWPLPAALEGRYSLEKAFDLEGLQRSLRNPFTQANPPIAVYRRVAR